MLLPKNVEHQKQCKQQPQNIAWLQSFHELAGRFNLLITVNEGARQDQNNLRLFTIALYASKCRRKCLRNLRFHHFVESLAHFLIVRLDLSHRRDVPLRDLMVILHVILQRLVVIVLNFLLGH